MWRQAWGGASAVLAFSVMVACGGSVSSDANAPSGGEGGGGSPSGGGAGVAASGGTGGLSEACPAVQPAEGTACAMGARLCPYNCADCNCSSGTWTCKPHVCDNPCSDLGEWCTDGAFRCQCWRGWSCQSASDPSAKYDMTQLPTSVSDGQPCANPNLVCQPKGSAGASCHCVGGVWKCAAPLPENTGCPDGFGQGQACAPEGLLCQMGGSCAPLCACTLQSTWDCELFTPC